MFVFVFILLLLALLFLNVGKWLDVTQKPVKSDVVICLGGGTIERVKKSIEMVEEGYANKMILLGESWYNQPYIKKNHPDIPVEIDETPKNTEEEVLFLKQYMQKRKYKSALIVTDPPHSARVKLLSSLISVEGDDTMTFRLIGSDVGWWNANEYYKNERARNAVKHEVMGIVCEVMIGTWRGITL